MEQKMRKQLAAIERFKAEFRIELLFDAELQQELKAMYNEFWRMAGDACQMKGVAMVAA